MGTKNISMLEFAEKYFKIKDENGNIATPQWCDADKVIFKLLDEANKQGRSLEYRWSRSKGYRLMLTEKK